MNNKLLSINYRWKKLDYYGKLIENNDLYNTEYYRRDRALEYQELGDQYAEIRDSAKLINCYNIAKDILSKLSADENKKYAEGFMIKGSEELTNQNFKEAEKYIRKSLNIYIASYGEANTDVVLCLDALGSIYLKRNRLYDCKVCADKAVSIMEALYPEGSPDFYTCYMNQSAYRLGLLNIDSQKFAKNIISSQQVNDYGAEDSINKMLETVESFFSDNSEELETTIGFLVNLYFIKYALGDTSYGQKMKTLAAKYPQHVKKAMDNLQKQIGK